MSSRNAILAITALALAGALWVRSDRKAAHVDQNQLTSLATTQVETPAEPGPSVVAAAGPGTQKTPKPLPAFIELGSDRCKSCKAMIPVLKRLRKDAKGRLKVQFFDVWDDEAAGKRFRVRSIPTQVFQDATGKEIFRHSGYFPFTSVVAKWTELGFDILGTSPRKKLQVKPRREPKR